MKGGGETILAMYQSPGFRAKTLTILVDRATDSKPTGTTSAIGSASIERRLMVMIRGYTN